MTDRINPDNPLGDLDPTRAVRPTSPSRSARGGVPANGSSHRRDDIEISARAVHMNLARSAVDAAPETRSALVERLQQEIADGSYVVDSRALAEKLLPVLFPDRFGG